MSGAALARDDSSMLSKKVSVRAVNKTRRYQLMRMPAVRAWLSVPEATSPS
jgi:hypothetical protein